MAVRKRLHVRRRHEQAERAQRDPPEPGGLKRALELAGRVIARPHDVTVQRHRHAAARESDADARANRRARRYSAISHGHTRPITDAISRPSAPQPPADDLRGAIELVDAVERAEVRVRGVERSAGGITSSASMPR